MPSAYAIAEFNLLAIDHAPTRQDVEAYVRANFTVKDETYRIPVHQEFLMIRPRARTATA